MQREFPYPTCFSCNFALIRLYYVDFDFRFRSSTEETSASLGDRDRYQIRPHDDALEHTADLQERVAGDAAPEADLPKPPSPLGKKMNEPEFVLVSSSGEPSSSKSHVSLKFPAFTTRIFACQ
jgi:hypothetical protein